MNAVELIAECERRTRKPHTCYECLHSIPVGAVAYVQTCKYDDLYTLYSHPDCRDAADHWRADTAWSDYPEGTPSLLDEIADSGQFQEEVDALRGFFPHVATRLEWWMQKREADR